MSKALKRIWRAMGLSGFLKGAKKTLSGTEDSCSLRRIQKFYIFNELFCGRVFRDLLLNLGSQRRTNISALGRPAPLTGRSDHPATVANCRHEHTRGLPLRIANGHRVAASFRQSRPSFLHPAPLHLEK